MLFLETHSEDVSYNFAVEYYILNEKKPPEQIFLLWRTSPTLMAGRFQNIENEINMKYAREKNIKIVRRQSGGGTIYTDPGTWQYTYYFPDARGDISFAENAAEIVRALGEMGVPAEFGQRNDILLNGKKISGTARYAAGSGIIHHGSLLYSTDIDEMARAISPDNEKMLSKGIKSVRQRVTNISEHIPQRIHPLEFKKALLHHILGEKPSEYILNEKDIQRILKIKSEIFDSWQWNFGTNPRFSVTKSKRFAGGRVNINYTSRGGIIESAAISGDFFFEGDLDAFLNSLKGSRLDYAELSAKLKATAEKWRFFQIEINELVELILY